MMSTTETIDVAGTFVGEKICKVRWQPVPENSIVKSQVFASGSWDNGINKLCLWSMSNDLNLKDGIDEVSLLSECKHIGDVTGIQFISSTDVIVSSSTGDVGLYKCGEQNTSIEAVHWWRKVHQFSGGAAAACTSLAVRSDGGQLATGGEDGRLCILAPGENTVQRVIEQSEGSSVLGVSYCLPSQVLTVGLSGYLKLWDLRDGTGDRPSQTYVISSTGREPLNCVSVHPSQSHVVATGGRDGTLYIWDLRQDTFPVSLLEAHTSDMWEVQFHPLYNDHLFTCSEDGSVWHWDASQLAPPPHLGPPPQGAASPWLSCEGEGVTARLRIESVLPASCSAPVNCLHVDRDVLVCGSDSEQIWTVLLPALC